MNGVVRIERETPARLAARLFIAELAMLLFRKVERRAFMPVTLRKKLIILLQQPEAAEKRVAAQSSPLI